MVKKIVIIVSVIVALLIVDLYTFELILEDPGYYVVARRSDHPKQVLDAIDRLNLKETSRKQLRVLIQRYHGKAKSNKLPPEKRELWNEALRKTRELLKDRSENS